MIKSISKLSLTGILAALILGVPVRVSAQAQEPALASPAPAVPTKPKAIPFKGKLTAVDKPAMTITVSKRTFSITSETKLFKDGKPATLADGVVGERVTGSYFKGDDGKLTAKSVYWGGKGGTTETAKPKGTNAPAQ
jgi:hypothetical protein